MTEIVVAPAKLTRNLRVIGVRPDGYHDIEAEMVALDLCDELSFDTSRPGTTVEAQDHGASPLAQDRLVARALEAVGREAHVRLTKRIPTGGGLGGGSSDAAAALRWAGCADLALAARIGADVPFCLTGGRALVRGIGEDVRQLPYEATAFVLVLPPFGVSTAAVYGAWDHLAERAGSLQDDSPNALTAAALLIEPRLAAWGAWLSERVGSPAVLAGSGSTWFVEGSLNELGLDQGEVPEAHGETGRLLEVHTVPKGWTGEAM